MKIEVKSILERIFEVLRKKSKGIRNIINRLLRIVFWPARAVISIVEHVLAGVTVVGKGCVFLAKELVTFLKDIWNKHKNEQENWEKIVQLLNQVMATGMPLFQNTGTNNIINVLVILLQTISFFTTYGGTKYYFAQIGGFAPVFLAAAIQITIITFSIGVQKKERKQKAQKIVLALTVCVSMLFSYVGVANSTIAPHENYTRIYEDVRSASANMREGLKNDTKYTYSPLAAANVIYEQVQRGKEFFLIGESVLAGDTAVDELENRLAAALQLKSTTTTVTETEDGEKTTIDSKPIEGIGEIIVAISENAAEQGIMDSLQSATNKLAAVLQQSYNVDMKGEQEAQTVDIAEFESIIRAYMTEEEENNEFYNMHADYVDITAAINAVAKIFMQSEDASDGETDGETTTGSTSNEQHFPTVPITEFSKKLKAYDALSQWEKEETVEVTDTETDNGAQGSAGNPEGKDMLGIWTDKVLRFIDDMLRQTTTTEAYQEVLEKYINSTRDIMQKISHIVPEPAKSEYAQSWKTIQDGYTDFTIAPDASIVAFSRLFKKETYLRMIVPAFLAVLIDGGTVVLAWGGKRRRYSTLYANTNRDYFEEEIDLFEQVFICVMENKVEKAEESSETLQPAKAEEYVEKVLETINFVKCYLDKFEPSPETAEWGCGLRVKSSDLDTKHSALTSLLLNMGYLCPISEWQLTILKEDRLDVTKDKGTTYYCLKFRAENYLRQCMTNTNLYMNYFLNCILKK